MVLLQVFLLVAFCATGWAADGYGVSPGAVERSLEKEMVPRGVQLPRIEVADEKTGALKGGEGVTFELKGVTFEGNTVFSTEELNQVVENNLDKTIEVSALQVLADKVTSYYINNGYILTRAYLPPQTIDNGRVLVRVREGRLGKVIVKGNERYREDIIKNTIMVMKKKGAVKTTDLERSLLLLMDYPSLSVKATLVAGDDPGTTDIIVDVTEGRMIGFGLDYNNYGTEYVAQDRVGGNLSIYNLGGWGDAVNLNLNYGFGSGDLMYGRLEYIFPVYYWGTKIGLVASKLDYEGGKELAVLDLDGDTSTIGMWVSHPFIRTRNISLWADAGVDYKSTKSDTFAYRHQDDITVGRMGSTVDWLDSLGGRNIASAKLSKGLNSDSLELRWDTDPKFTKAELRFNRFQRHAWDVDSILSLGGQLSSDRVPSSEMISIGGAGTVRGYDQSEFSGDSGMYGTLEFRVPVWKRDSLDWSVLQSEGTVLQVAAFMDYGLMRKNDTDVSEIDNADMFGVGLGLRFAMSPWIQAKIDYAKSVDGDEPIEDEGKWYIQLSTFY
jgi:hemolysin activation/secretion protein